ncbi:hypothetical protein ACJU26_09270 [Acidithiobacillus sp. M4-SHS-6]|uniref:hypothetical protein n=1 Tax=Acidithiobacillus sp. M4-SHS-6 TaxID=3383024 RepID=UPI0039BE2003
MGLKIIITNAMMMNFAGMEPGKVHRVKPDGLDDTPVANRDTSLLSSSDRKTQRHY